MDAEYSTVDEGRRTVRPGDAIREIARDLRVTKGRCGDRTGSGRWRGRGVAVEAARYRGND